MMNRTLSVILLALAMLLASVPAQAELCGKCSKMMYIMSVGKCVDCGGFTGSGAHKLCRKCSKKLGECEHCRVKLKDAVKLDAKTAERVKLLKADWKKFTLSLRYFGESGKPFYNLTLRVPQIKDDRPTFWPAAQLNEKQATAIIDHLVKDGYLRRAGNQAKKDLKAPAGPTYGLFVRGPRGLELYEFLGWDLKMLKRLDALNAVLSGEARKKMDLLLGRLSGYRRHWETEKKKVRPEARK
jgi:hypothetical protein